VKNKIFTCKGMITVQNYMVFFYFCNAQLVFGTVGIFSYQSHTYFRSNLGRKFFFLYGMEKFLAYFTVSFFLRNGHCFLLIYLHVYKPLFKPGYKTALPQLYFQGVTVQRTVKYLPVVQFSCVMHSYRVVCFYFTHKKNISNL